jgi:hypothetical protein
MNNLNLCFNLPITAKNAGLFISRGKGEHPDRVIDSFELIFVTKSLKAIANLIFERMKA